MSRFRGALIALSLIALVNCGGSEPTTPSTPSTPASLTGAWVGATTDSRLGTGSIVRASLSQSGVQLTGTWESSFPSISDDNDNNGTLSGSVNGSRVSATLVLSGVPGMCSFAVTATLNADATQMLGTYAVAGCSIAPPGSTATSGSITLTKQ